MTDTSARQYTFSLPEDTADLFDKFCREQPNSPANNIASRLLRSGIEVVLMLHPNWQERLDYEPHKMSEAARLSEALRAELDEAKAEIERRHNAQSYTYIGKDGKSVQARDLEDERDQALAQFYECQNMLADAKAEVERLREALVPFAAMLKPHHDALIEDHPVMGIEDSIFTVGDLRNAVQALKGSSQ